MAGLLTFNLLITFQVCLTEFHGELQMTAMCTTIGSHRPSADPEDKTCPRLIAKLKLDAFDIVLNERPINQEFVLTDNAFHRLSPEMK